MRFTKIAFLCLLLAIFIFPAESWPQDYGKLQKIVVLSRHGVRAPTQNHRILNSWSQKEWPKWPVKHGDLTTRGAELVTAMWENLRPEFNEQKLLPNGQCPPPHAVYVRADTDERTQATAAAILDGLAPDCGLGYAVMDEKIDPLFHPVKAGLYQFNPVSAATSVLTRTGGSLENLQDDFASAINLVCEITGPPAPALCTRFTLMPNCQISDLPNAISVSSNGDDIKLVGALSVTSSLAEIFLLEYGQWPGETAGWGMVDASILDKIMPVHSKIFDVINRAPLVAWARGGALLKEIGQALAGTHPNPAFNEARLAIFVGHDTNIANIGGLLDLDWQDGSYPPNGIPPAGALFFELWEKDGKKEVVAKFLAQPMEALHASLSGEVDLKNFAPRQAAMAAPTMPNGARFDLDTFLNRIDVLTTDAPAPMPQKPVMRYGMPSEKNKKH